MADLPAYPTPDPGQTVPQMWGDFTNWMRTRPTTAAAPANLQPRSRVGLVAPAAVSPAAVAPAPVAPVAVAPVAPVVPEPVAAATKAAAALTAAGAPAGPGVASRFPSWDQFYAAYTAPGVAHRAMREAYSMMPHSPAERAQMNYMDLSQAMARSPEELQAAYMNTFNPMAAMYGKLYGGGFGAQGGGAGLVAPPPPGTYNLQGYNQ